ncbi:ABC transporter substrate-binding protein [Spirillospora sp. CA-255316]
MRARSLRWSALALATVLLASACGGSGSGGDGKVLRAAYQYNPQSLDPATQTGSYAPVALGLIFDTLVRVGPDGALQPGLAEKWAFAADGSALTLTLRDGVKFSDGSALDAETVKTNLDRSRGKTFEKTAFKGDLSAISDITTSGRDVVLKIAKGAGGAELPAVLSDRPGMIASAASLARPDFDQKPVGAGPYKLVSFDPGAKLTVTRWDGYWDAAEKRNAGVELNFVKDSSARLRGLQSGQYDWATVDPAQLSEVGSAGLKTVAGQTLSYNRITFNRSRTWFADARVREALSLAVDRPALVKGLLFGAGKPAYQPFPANYWAADPAVTATAYDPDRAKRLLAEAGYPNGFQFEAVAANNPAAVQIAEGVAAQLAKVGVKVRIRPVENSTVTFYNEKRYDAWIGPWGGRADPAQTLSLQYTKGKLQNPGGTASKEIEDLAAKALIPGTDAERTTAIRALTAQVLKENLDIFLFFADNIQAHTGDLTGVRTWVNDKPQFRGVLKS